MKKYTVYGALYLEDQNWLDEWYAEVELNDEQARSLLILIMWHGGDTNVESIHLKETFPDIYDILDKACYQATLNAYNDYLRFCGQPKVDKWDYEYEVNVPHEFQDIF
jgi:hypothetical protein